MDSQESFLSDLSERLGRYGNEVEMSVLPTLKTDFRNMTSTYLALLSVLSKKGLLVDDPYQYDSKISEIQPVSNEPFLEGQKGTVMSIRLHNFESQLEFLNDFYQFSLEFMTLQRLRNITLLTRFIRWDALSENSQDINTRALAEILSKIRKGDDAISIGLVNDLASQMNTIQAKILEGIKKVSLFKREEYKLMLRNTFWERLNLAAEEVEGNPDNVQKKIKKEFAASIKGYPYVAELIKELLDEDFAANAAHHRSELMHRLTINKVVKEKAKIVVDPRVNLMESVRNLASLNVPLESGLKKLQENSLLLEDHSNTLKDRFQRWLRSLIGIQTRQKVYEIELFDPATSTTRHEDLDFERFLEDGSTRIRLYVNIANRASAQFLALSQRTADEILEWFDRQFLDSSKMVERMNGLDLYFKTEVPKEKRQQVKGIKAEVSQIRTIMANANKLKHTYVGELEEQEQLRRLGIKA